MPYTKYIMESEDEAVRLDLKTDPQKVKRQAIWAGVEPGMRIADLGCGAGNTTYCLNQLASPGGSTLGVDISEQRIQYAKKKYSAEGIQYVVSDIREPLPMIGMFDFIWIRFVLEYYRAESYEILNNVLKALKPGGVLCVIDLDHNCLNHFGLSPRLQRALNGLMCQVEKYANFDPYIGRKLYTYFFDLGLRHIEVHMEAHHLIYGELKSQDRFNWIRKVELAGKRSGYAFDDYDGGFDEFFLEFTSFFEDTRRFTYTPLVACKGRKAQI